MIAVLQRVSEASVTVAGVEVARIDAGLLALVAVERGDSNAQAERLAERILAFRLFPDSDGKMNLSVTDAEGALLLVPQFTLAADTDRGNRPSFGRAADPDDGRRFFDALVAACSQHHPAVAAGRFGADMQVALVNDGPVTFQLQVRPRP